MNQNHHHHRHSFSKRTSSLFSFFFFFFVYLILSFFPSFGQSSSFASSSILAHPSFLKSTYPVKTDLNQKFYVRQVPGDGACLFHSIAVWISYIRYGKHYRFDWRLRSLSNTLRLLAVEMLKTNQTFYVENNEQITNEELLNYISVYNNITAKDYLMKMLRSTEWGGGPEIIALCNHFKCPIHVYELSTQGLFPKEFCLQISAKFGSPTFDDKLPICILHADGRFPYLDPNKFNENQLKEHFLALFPCEGEQGMIKKPSYFSSLFLRSGYSTPTTTTTTTTPSSSSPSSSYSSQSTGEKEQSSNNNHSGSISSSSASTIQEDQVPILTASSNNLNSNSPEGNEAEKQPKSSSSSSSAAGRIHQFFQPLSQYCNLEKCPEFSEDIAFFRKKATQSSSKDASPLNGVLQSFHSFMKMSKESFDQLLQRQK